MEQKAQMERRLLHASQSTVCDQHSNKQATQARLQTGGCRMHVSVLYEIFLHSPRSVKVKIPLHVHSKRNSLLYVNSHAVNLHRRKFLFVHSEEFSNCLHHAVMTV